MTRSVSTSAPGKLLLYGEHAVVYGYPSIVTAVDARLIVSIEESQSTTVEIHAPQVKDSRFVDSAIAEFTKLTGVSVGRIRLTTSSAFSGKFGFGSSSAVTVGVLLALSKYFSKPMTQRELFDIAYRAVMDVQGVGSGVDIAAAVFGGTLFYRKGGVTLEQLKIAQLPIVVGYSGVKSNTVELINQVAMKQKAEPEKFDRLMKAIGKLVEQTLDPLLNNDLERVGKFMDFNQEYLRDLGVSCEKLENLISAAKRAGAYGAKLSGAGGGDCMIALVSHEKRKIVEESITAAGGEVVHITPNAEGVKIEL